MHQMRGGVSRASLKMFTIGKGCIQHSTISPLRNTKRPCRHRRKMPHLNSRAGNCLAISLSHNRGALHHCPGFSEKGVRELPKHAFLSQFGLDTLRQLPDFEALEDAGLLSKESCWPAIFRLGWQAGKRTAKRKKKGSMSLETRRPKWIGALPRSGRRFTARMTGRAEAADLDHGPRRDRLRQGWPERSPD